MRRGSRTPGIRQAACLMKAFGAFDDEVGKQAHPDQRDDDGDKAGREARFVAGCDGRLRHDESPLYDVIRSVLQARAAWYSVRAQPRH